MATPELVPLPPSESIHPRGLLEALAAIEQSATNERQGCQIPEGFLTTRQRIEFMEVGIRSAIASGLVLSLFSPLAVAMLEGRIPVFGSTTPQLCDRLLVLLLTCGFSLGYALIIGRAAWQWQGKYSRAMVLNLVGGMLLTTVLKAFVVGMLYAGLALWLEQRGPLALALLVRQYGIAHETAVAWNAVLALLSDLLRKALPMIVVTALLAATLPLACFAGRWYQLRRLAGFRLEGNNHET